MALNIAAMQQSFTPVDSFLEGRAIANAEKEAGARMTALQNAEGRAAEEETRRAKRFDWEREETEIKFDQVTGQRALAKVQQVMALPKDQRKAYIEQNEPEYIKELEAKSGQSWADLDDDEIEGMGGMLIRKISGDLGLSPSKPAPLSDQGKVAADVQSGLLTQGQGDAILNAENWTKPEPGVVDGKEVMVQYNSKGEPRVVPGVAPRPQKPLVSIDTKVQSAGEVELAKIDAKDYSDLQNRGQAAQEKIGSLRAMLESPAQTGPTQDFRADANAFFFDLGVPIAQSKLDQISNLAQYKSIQNTLILQEQLKQKGPQTESDAKRIEAEFGNTKNTKEANELITKYQLALADRESTLAQLADEYRTSKGKVDGFRKEIREYVKNTPLAGKNAKSGRLVFFNEFRDAVREANPGVSDEEIVKDWRDRYATR